MSCYVMMTCFEGPNGEPALEYRIEAKGGGRGTYFVVFNARARAIHGSSILSYKWGEVGIRII